MNFLSLFVLQRKCCVKVVLNNALIFKDIDVSVAVTKFLGAHRKKKKKVPTGVSVKRG